MFATISLSPLSLSLSLSLSRSLSLSISLARSLSLCLSLSISLSFYLALSLSLCITFSLYPSLSPSLSLSPLSTLLSVFLSCIVLPRWKFKYPADATCYSLSSLLLFAASSKIYTSAQFPMWHEFLDRYNHTLCTVI